MKLKIRKIGGYPVEVHETRQLRTIGCLLGRRTDTNGDVWEVHIDRGYKTEFVATGSEQRMRIRYEELKQD